MRLIVHIGMSKTGTTALQDSLFRARPALRKLRVLYPANPSPPGGINHKFLVADLLDHDRLPRHLRRDLTPEQVAERQQAFRARLLEQVRARRWAGVVLSSESLFRSFNAAARGRLMALYAEIGAQPEVVAYLRRPSSHFVSGLQQHLKASSLVRGPKLPHYRNVLERHQMMTGPGGVHVHLFDRKRLAGGDIVTDFASRYLAGLGVVPADLPQSPQRNESLSAESVDLLRCYRAAFHAGRQDQLTADSTALVATLAAIDAELSSPRPALRPGLAEMIDYADTDPLWLRDHFGLEFPDFDYARLERGQLTGWPERDWALTDLLVIDPDLRAEIAARLAGSDWTGQDPARRDWISGLRSA